MAEDTLGLETVHLQELSVIVNTTSSFEEFFIRRNALVIFLHRILRQQRVAHNALGHPQHSVPTVFIQGLKRILLRAAVQRG